VLKQLLQAAKTGIPEAPPSIRTTGSRKYLDDPLIIEWTQRRRQLRTRLNGHPSKKNAAKYRRWRSVLKRQIRERIRFLAETRAQKVATYLEQFKGNRRCFEAVAIMKKYEYKPLQLQDEDKNLVYNRRSQFPMIHEFYRSFFNQIGRDTPINPWDGDPRPLENPITEAEVEEAVKKLNNGRAYGKDGTPGELQRYGGPNLCKHLTIIYNQMLKQGQIIDEIGEGILITLNKQNGKPSTINNIRPITLLNMIRKILSKVALARIQDIILLYVSPTQSACSMDIQMDHGNNRQI